MLAGTPVDAKEYEKERETALKANMEANLQSSDPKPVAGALMMNFRLRLSTSSEMVRSPGLEAELIGQHADGAHVRDKGAEYIVGGWCIGNVLDSAAARASLPGMRGLYAPSPPPAPWPSTSTSASRSQATTLPPLLQHREQGPKSVRRGSVQNSIFNLGVDDALAPAAVQNALDSATADGEKHKFAAFNAVETAKNDIEKLNTDGGKLTPDGADATLTAFDNANRALPIFLSANASNRRQRPKLKQID